MKYPHTAYRIPHNPFGFTLVELLVVISIIAILATMGMTTYTGAQRNARDARRRTDIDAIAKAMEVNYARFVASEYAGLCQTVLSPVTYDCTNRSWFSNGFLPSDPQASASIRYCWVASGTCTNTTGTALGQGAPPQNTPDWVVCATLEIGGGTQYCRGNQQ